MMDEKKRINLYEFSKSKMKSANRAPSESTGGRNFYNEDFPALPEVVAPAESHVNNLKTEDSREMNFQVSYSDKLQINQKSNKCDEKINSQQCSLKHNLTSKSRVNSINKRDMKIDKSVQYKVESAEKNNIYAKCAKGDVSKKPKNENNCDNQKGKLNSTKSKFSSQDNNCERNEFSHKHNKHIALQVNCGLSSNVSNHLTSESIIEHQYHKKNKNSEINKSVPHSEFTNDNYKKKHLQNNENIDSENKLNKDRVSKQELRIVNKTSNKKNKMKKQTAFQSGKLLILKPELHSFIAKCLTDSESETVKNFSTDIESLTEYPALGSQATTSSQTSTEPSIQNLSVKNNLNSGNQLCSHALSNENTETRDWRLSHEIIKLPLEEKLALKSSHEDKEIYDDSLKIVEKDKKINADTKLSTNHQIQLSEILAVSKGKNKSKVKDDNLLRSPLSKTNKAKETVRGLNILDSSVPNIKRGKERENPKRKKFTPLKKVILSERLRKKEMKDLELKNNSCNNSELLSPINETKIDEVCSELKNKANISANLQDKSLNDIKNLFEFDEHLKNASCANENISENYLAFVPEKNVDFDHSKIDIAEGESHNVVNSHKLTNNKVDILINMVQLDEVKSSNSQEVQYSSLKANFEEVDSLQDKNYAAQFIIHNKDFREYCNNLLSKELNEMVFELLDTLARFQDRQHQKDPIKARMKRRLVYGIKEVTKHLKLKKLKCVIIAPDLEDIQTEGGLNTALTNIKQIAIDYHIPCIFANSRRQLGKVCRKPVPVSCLGIFSYEGSEALYKTVMDLLDANTKDYNDLKQIIIDNVTSENLQEIALHKKEGTKNLSPIRFKILKSILCEKIKDSELTGKYDPDIFTWFTAKYILK